MKRILQNKTIGIALTLVLLLAAAVPALAASTCNASSAQPCSLSSEEILAKLEACGLSISQLEKYGTCPNSVTNAGDTQTTSASCPTSNVKAATISNNAANCPLGTSTANNACTQADCSANGCAVGNCTSGSCTKSSCASNQCVSADDNAVASAVAPKATTDPNSVKDAVSKYVAGKSSCPTGSTCPTSTCPTSTCPTGSSCPTSTCPTGSTCSKNGSVSSGSTCPKSGSVVKSANTADIQAAAQKLIDQATSQSGSSCNSAKAADILNQLQNSGLYSCSK